MIALKNIQFKSLIFYTLFNILLFEYINFVKILSSLNFIEEVKLCLVF